MNTNQSESSDNNPGTIEANMIKVLKVLADQSRSVSGEAWTSGKELKKATGLSPAEINDAVELLEARGLVETLQTIGTAPYRFQTVTITASGRYELENR